MGEQKEEVQELDRSIRDTKTTDEIEIAKNPKDVAKLSYVTGVITGILYTFNNNAGSGWQLDGGFLIFSFLFLFINVLYCLITCVPIGFLVGYVVHKAVNDHELREKLSILLGIGVGIIGGIVSGILTNRFF